MTYEVFMPDHCGNRDAVERSLMKDRWTGRWLFGLKGHSWGDFPDKAAALAYLEEVREEDRAYRARHRVRET